MTAQGDNMKDTVNIQRCAHCGLNVIPPEDGLCPGCGRSFAPMTQAKIDAIYSNDSSKPPGCIVIVAVINLVFALFLAWYALVTPAPETCPRWVMFLLSIATLIMAVGFLKMKRWAFVLYICFFVVFSLLLPLLSDSFTVTNILRIGAQILIVGALWKYRSQMT